MGLNAPHLLMQYRTMRAAETLAGDRMAPREKPSLWKRWQAAVYRWSDKLLR